MAPVTSAKMGAISALLSATSALRVPNLGGILSLVAGLNYILMYTRA